jgi:hypothetical protein
MTAEPGNFRCCATLRCVTRRIKHFTTLHNTSLFLLFSMTWEGCNSSACQVESLTPPRRRPGPDPKIQEKPSTATQNCPLSSTVTYYPAYVTNAFPRRLPVTYCQSMEGDGLDRKRLVRSADGILWAGCICTLALPSCSRGCGCGRLEAEITLWTDLI